MIIDHNHTMYRSLWNNCGDNKWNGAFYYSKEIVKHIIPRVKTNRNWVTINVRGVCPGHSIVFIHNNLHPERYAWLENVKDLILVCGIEKTAEFLKRYHHPTIVLPLSVDVESVKQYERPKTKYCAYAGRPAKAQGYKFPKDCDMLTGLPRNKLLPAMAEFECIYAVGRTAIEAKILGCEILPYDTRYPDPSIWEVLDCADAAKILQEKLDKVEEEMCQK